MALLSHLEKISRNLCIIFLSFFRKRGKRAEIIHDLTICIHSLALAYGLILHVSRNMQLVHRENEISKLFTIPSRQQLEVLRFLSLSLQQTLILIQIQITSAVRSVASVCDIRVRAHFYYIYIFYYFVSRVASLSRIVLWKFKMCFLLYERRVTMKRKRENEMKLCLRCNKFSLSFLPVCTNRLVNSSAGTASCYQWIEKSTWKCLNLFF